eukprot:TRINITY_DN4191_c0_g1_i1.p1 TRINITY_DN4191_c0_g1~~TRINITY_DN4191_c0_g1_i1.p1  ORF type:complete len:108 (+),score=37.62 TRINITY_DN4191_c0_g1_i1:14-337(+)
MAADPNPNGTRVATTMFRLMNPELFIKPRFWVNALGTSLALGSGYYIYRQNKHWQDTKEEREQMEIEKQLKLEAQEQARMERLKNNPEYQRAVERDRKMEEAIKRNR